MNLLLDNNLSYKIKKPLSDIFPNITHVSDINLSTAMDIEIWNYAKNNDYVLITKDSDFYELSLLFGSPPKVIWLKTRNISTISMVQILRINFLNITNFFANPDESCLILYR